MLTKSVRLRRLYCIIVHCAIGGGGGEIIVESSSSAPLWMGCSTIRLVTANYKPYPRLTERSDLELRQSSLTSFKRSL